jgi:CheY-like chemotaxis protein
MDGDLARYPFARDKVVTTQGVLGGLTPYVVTTSLHSSEFPVPRERVAAFEVGGVDYITKPFQAEEVLARVETHSKQAARLAICTR